MCKAPGAGLHPIFFSDYIIKVYTAEKKIKRRERVGGEADILFLLLFYFISNKTTPKMKQKKNKNKMKQTNKNVGQMVRKR